MNTVYNSVGASYWVNELKPNPILPNPTQMQQKTTKTNYFKLARHQFTIITANV